MYFLNESIFCEECIVCVCQEKRKTISRNIIITRRIIFLKDTWKNSFIPIFKHRNISCQFYFSIETSMGGENDYIKDEKWALIGELK